MHPTSRVVSDALFLVRYHRPDIDRMLDRVPVISGPLPASTGALYNDETRRITLNKFNDWEADSLASLLIHEGTHALDHATGILKVPRYSLDDHVMPEIRAFHAQAEFWQRLFPYGKVPVRTNTDVMNNIILEELKTGQLDKHVEVMYRPQWHAALAAARRNGWRIN